MSRPEGSANDSVRVCMESEWSHFESFYLWRNTEGIIACLDNSTWYYSVSILWWFTMIHEDRSGHRVTERPYTLSYFVGFIWLNLSLDCSIRNRDGIQTKIHKSFFIFLASSNKNYSNYFFLWSPTFCRTVTRMINHTHHNCIIWFMF